MNYVLKRIIFVTTAKLYLARVGRKKVMSFLILQCIKKGCLYRGPGRPGEVPEGVKMKMTNPDKVFVVPLILNLTL